MSSVIDSIERAQVKKGLPSFDAGDRVRVHFQVIEGSRRRTQVFEGIVLKRQGSGARETFTVRKQSFGVGVERTFPLHSLKIEQLEIAARGAVRRAKLYYLRDRVGKAARVAERRWGIGEEVLGTTGEGAVDAQGATQIEAPQAMPATGDIDGEEALEEVDQADLEAEVEVESDATSDEGAAVAPTEPAGEPEGEATESDQDSDADDEASRSDA
jgi:large subunit ribosomal protein L19